MKLLLVAAAGGVLGVGVLWLLLGSQKAPPSAVVTQVKTLTRVVRVPSLSPSSRA